MENSRQERFLSAGIRSGILETRHEQFPGKPPLVTFHSTVKISASTFLLVHPGSEQQYDHTFHPADNSDKHLASGNKLSMYRLRSIGDKERL